MGFETPLRKLTVCVELIDEEFVVHRNRETPQVVRRKLVGEPRGFEARQKETNGVRLDEVVLDDASPPRQECDGRRLLDTSWAAALRCLAWLLLSQGTRSERIWGQRTETQ